MNTEIITQESKLKTLFLISYHPYFWISLIAIIVFGQSLTFDLTYSDDDYYVLTNYKFNRDISNVVDAFKRNYTGTYYRPIVTLSLKCNAMIGKTAPFIYHLTNLIIHIVVSCLLFFLLTKLNYSRTISLLCGFLFAVHPISISVTAWIMGRNDSLVTVFILISFISFLIYQEKNSYLFLSIHLLSFALALLTKEIAVVLPVLCLIFLWLQKRKKIVSLSNVFAFIGWGAISMLWYILRTNAIEGVTNPGIVGFNSFILNLPALPAIIGKLVLPIHLSTLATFDIISIVTGCLVIVGFVLLIVKNRDFQNSNILFWTAWFILFLLPTLFMRLKAADDLFDYLECRAYLPMIGFMIVGIELLVSRKINFEKRRGILISVVIILAFSIRSIVYSDAYKNRINYFTNAAQTSPNKALIHYNLGKAYCAAHDFTNAEQQFLKSITLNSTRADTYVDLADIYYQRGLSEKAFELNHKALTLNQRHPLALSNIATLYALQGSFDDAVRSWKNAIEIDNNLIAAYENLFRFYFIHQRYQEAVSYFQETKTRDIKPPDEALQSFAFYFNRNAGREFYMMNDFENARKHFEKAIELNPTNADSYIDIGAVYFATGYLGKAVEVNQKALSLNPLSAQAYSNLGVAYNNLGREDEAVTMWKKALECDQDLMSAYENLFQHYYARKNIEQAVHYAKELMKRGRKFPSSIMKDLHINPR